MHSVFSGYFSRLDVITMPSSLDVVALGARKRVRGRALAGRSYPRCGRITGRLGLPPRGAMAARLATSRCPRLLPLPRVAAALRAAP